ncbi:hypothetical protein LAWI1_G001868 [Lachnellula willkommii]|uniref:Serine aminopeptidase S33 domain-containing protein n=1 Tax=Lachnellula willkommii TaxID=215461 RepID=A0A559ML95_9HELO|nr:hypothetical protein LAWI1_G001868 [Lachnellula willkommii]
MYRKTIRHPTADDVWKQSLFRKNATVLPATTQAALDYERASYATGSVIEDPFYTTPEGTANATAGTLLKVEEDANATAFTIPPNTAISRFIYQSKNLNGTLVPVSAYVLWPFSPRSQADGYQVVAWAHGTIGFSTECAPSHFRNLWQHFLAPYQLALQGYVVVATDYAGLGVGKNSAGEAIIHEYLASPAAANDVIYSVQAAREAFPKLSKDFVVMGHSQGGGAAWATAQRQVIQPIPGYLGAVAVSPVTTILGDPDPSGSSIGVAMSPGIASVFPEFKTTDIMEADGQQALDTLLEVQGCSAVATDLLIPPLLTGTLIQPNWRENTFVQKYQALTANGGKEIAGPMLVVHGEADPLLDVNLTKSAVQETVSRFPSSQLDFHLLPNTSHVPALTGSQSIWMDWIAERFKRSPVLPYSGPITAVLARPASSYSPELNWFVGLATQSFETP